MNHEAIAAALYSLLDSLRQLPKTRQLALAATKLEEAIHWIAADENERTAITGPRVSPELHRVLKEMNLASDTVAAHAPEEKTEPSHD